MRLILILLLIFISAQDSFSQKDSVGYYYQYDLKYEGASTKIDMNYRYVLEKLIEELQNDSKLNVHVRGHVCCSPGVRLSKKRARKVKRFLIKNGIDKQRVSFKGYSNEAPLAFPEKTDEDERRNRRVDFIIYYYQ